MPILHQKRFKEVFKTVALACHRCIGSQVFIDPYTKKQFCLQCGWRENEPIEEPDNEKYPVKRGRPDKR